VLGAWEREDTYFAFELSSYDTNFGIADYIGEDQFPELYYNIVIKRKFENAFIIHVLPLFLVTFLLFASLLTVSGNSERAEKHGFNTTAIIGVCSALFFVVLMAHIELRSQFDCSGVVYIEYFFFLMYVVLAMTAINTYLFSTESAQWFRVIYWEDNLLPKLLYWPLVLGGMTLITLLHINEYSGNYMLN